MLRWVYLCYFYPLVTGVLVYSIYSGVSADSSSLSVVDEFDPLKRTSPTEGDEQNEDDGFITVQSKRSTRGGGEMRGGGRGFEDRTSRGGGGGRERGAFRGNLDYFGGFALEAD